MMKFKLYYILFFLSISLINSQIIDSIIIRGNKRTKEQIILRELSHNKGDKLDLALLIKDKNKLYNLGLFSKVDIYIEDNIYKIDLVETFSIIPVPLIDYDEDDDKWTIGMALVDINFLGKNQKVSLEKTFTGDKNNIIKLFNPWFFGNHGSLEINLGNIDSYNIFHDININKIFYSVRVGGYFKDFHRLNFLIGNTKYELDKTEKYNFNQIIFGYLYDKRNIYIDPTRGFLLGAKFSFNKDIYDRNDISKISFIFNYYKIIHSKIFIDPVLAFKVKALFKYPNFDKLPIFEHEYLGGENFIRGYKSNKPPTDIRLEYTNVIYNSFELQSTILARKNYSFNSLPGFEFGIDGLLFIDIGLGSNRYNEFYLDKALVGYGFGFKFFMSSGQNIAVIFGYNPYGQSHLHFRDD